MFVNAALACLALSLWIFPIKRHILIFTTYSGERTLQNTNNSPATFPFVTDWMSPYTTECAPTYVHMNTAQEDKIQNPGSSSVIDNGISASILGCLCMRIWTQD